VADDSGGTSGGVMSWFSIHGSRRVAGIGVLFAVLASCLRADPEAPRLISIGGPVTEIVYALDANKNLIGTDTSSIYPEAATKLPQVGYQRSLSAEGVLGLRPTLILASADAGPTPVVEQLKQSGVNWVTIPAENSVEGAKAKIGSVAHALHRDAQGEALVLHLDEEIVKAQGLLASEKSKPKVLFIYARGGGTVNVAGQGTAADAMITLAGGVNAVTGYTGYKPITAEAVVAAAPDIILIPSRGLESVSGIDGLLAQPGLAETPAGKSRKVVAMDDLLLLGFGPRLGEAVLQLTKLLHGQESAATAAAP
jgi:iron complex transport system substrate-binding protein